MKKFTELSEEVASFFNDYNYIDKVDIKYLIKKAKNLTSKKYRLCMHQDTEAQVHEMFIVHPKNMYVRPHKHEGKSESLMVISGKAEYIIFKENGNIDKKIPLSSYNGHDKFFIKINKNLYHSINILSDWFIFLEVTKGPFYRQDTIFPDWAPSPEDRVQVKKFMDKISKK